MASPCNPRILIWIDMKKKDIFVNGSAAYEPPQINIFTFEVEGVLCGSIGGDGGSGTGDFEEGGTVGGNEDDWGWDF